MLENFPAAAFTVKPDSSLFMPRNCSPAHVCPGSVRLRAWSCSGGSAQWGLLLPCLLLPRDPGWALCSSTSWKPRALHPHGLPVGTLSCCGRARDSFCLSLQDIYRHVLLEISRKVILKHWQILIILLWSNHSCLTGLFLCYSVGSFLWSIPYFHFPSICHQKFKTFSS